MKLKTRLYFGFEDEPLNNATILSYWQYIGGLGLFQGLYRLLDEDLKKVIAFLEELEKSGEDPRELIQRRLLGKTQEIQ
ncbi:MAG: hypothetical protein GTO13_08715 [Proteobacteria bacterium]|nr:hypothetical protein [Pseudomonadota bacterium]